MISLAPTFWRLESVAELAFPSRIVSKCFKVYGKLVFGIVSRRVPVLTVTEAV